MLNLINYGSIIVFFDSIVSHSALNDMMALDKEVKKQTIMDYNEEQFYDCFDEAKTAELLQIMSK